MKKHILSTAAGIDIDEIVQAISKDSPQTAEKWVISLQDKCRGLAQFPHIGRLRGDLRPDMYCFPYGNYLIFYKITESAVIVVRVVHGARNLPEVFREEEAEEPTPSKTR